MAVKLGTQENKQQDRRQWRQEVDSLYVFL